MWVCGDVGREIMEKEMNRILYSAVLVIGIICASSVSAQTQRPQHPNIQRTPGQQSFPLEHRFPNTVQNVYLQAKKAKSCSELTLLIKTLRTYLHWNKSIPHGWHPTILYPKRKRYPTLADMARDRIIRLRKSGLHKKLCSRK